MTRFVCALFLSLTVALALTACGGGGGGGANGGGSGGTPTPTPSPSAGAVTVTAGGVTGADITVAGATAATPPNAQFLGVTANGSGSAFSTGDQIQQGTTRTIIMFGAGLTGNMTIKIGGPGDITVLNQQGITSTGGSPGIAFGVVVSPTAVLGPRTVYLTSGNDMTTFTGGLEVVQ